MNVLSESIAHEERIKSALKACEINTVEKLLRYDSKELSLKTGLQLTEVDELKSSIAQVYCPGFLTAVELYKSIKSYKYTLETGVGFLDEFLNGGIRTGETLEIQGASCSGKTQLCMSIAASLSLRNEVTIIYMDFGNSFSPRRVLEIMKNKMWKLSVSSTAFDESIRRGLASIKCLRLYDILDLSRAISALDFQSLIAPIRLILIDSITALISPRPFSTTAYSMISMLFRYIQVLCMQHGCSFVYAVKQSSPNTYAAHSSFGPILRRKCSSTIFLKSDNDGNHRAYLMRSPLHISGVRMSDFTISDEGIS